MRLLFPMDAQNYDPAWRVFQRDSARAILLRGGRATMIYSRKYAYYKFPGGGIEPLEAPVQALLRETEEEAGLRFFRRASGNTAASAASRSPTVEQQKFSGRTTFTISAKRRTILFASGWMPMSRTRASRWNGSIRFTPLR